jgi:hypothetical protein
MKKFKTSFKVLCLIAALIVVVSGCTQSGPVTETPEGSDNQPRATQMGIATATVGGAYYPMGQAIANVVNAHYDGVVLNAEVTNGALENNRLINDGESALAITNADLAYYAYNGQAPYDAKQNVVAIGNLHPSVFHIITLGNSPINSIEDLKGKRIACGPAGGASIGIMQNILAEYGMSFDDIIPSYLPYSDGYTQMTDGNVDVALATSGYPAAAVMEVVATNSIKFLEVDPDILEDMLDKYPYYTDANVPGDVYKLESDVTAIGIANVFVCNPDMDEEVAYNITKALYDNVAELKANNKTAEQMDETKLSATSIPLHPGAQRYFDEN